MIQPKQKLSNKICPENMTLEEWQVALRRENAVESGFIVEHLDDNALWGDYAVKGESSNYRVAFRGVQSDRNFCSCLDFRTSGLGTCKHIEAVTLYLSERIPGYPWADMVYTPDYTSLYISYRDGRKLKMRVGEVEHDRFEELLYTYFDADGCLREEHYQDFEAIVAQGEAIAPGYFKVYDDVKDFARLELQRINWLKELDESFPERAIPWNKKSYNSTLQRLESLLFRATREGYGLLVGKSSADLMHFVARLVEEVYQGEDLSLKSYIIVSSAKERSAWQSILSQYTEAKLLPLQVVTSDEFVRASQTPQPLVAFVYVADGVSLREWNGQLSQSIKKRPIKHLYIHLETLKAITPVQLSSVIQHISPYILGPFYRFIYRYRALFPLKDVSMELPEVMQRFTYILSEAKPQMALAQFADIELEAAPVLMEEDMVDEFLAQLSKILGSTKAIKILRERLAKLK